MSTKKQLLDPLGTMCKLVALNFNEKNTKISIQNHILTIQSPTGYQFMIRFYNGDGRENISELYYVIIRIVKWYLVTSSKVNKVNQVDRKDQEIFYEKNEETIDDSISDSDESEDSENYYNSEDNSVQNNITIINTFDNNNSDNKSNDSYDNDDNDNNHNNDNSNDSDTSENKNSKGLYNSPYLKKMLKYMCNAFRKIQETYEYGNVVFALQFYINLIEDAMNGIFDDNKLPKYVLEKDKEFQNLLDYNKLKNLWTDKKLSDISELYDKCFEIKYDNDRDTKSKTAFINSYLRSIYSILETTDNEFLNLIHNSQKG